MPELPEVQVLVSYLQQALPGRKIVDVDVRREKSIRPNSPSELIAGLQGHRFERVERRAKYLIFHLKHGRQHQRLLGHLGMTGRLYIQPKQEELPKHTALALELDKGRFVFEDTRYFGRISLDLSALDKLGPEPLSDAFQVATFHTGLKRSRQAIKVRLLATDLVVGVGNIYASEALHRARINPRTPACRLSKKRVERLHAAIRATLEEAIQLGSTLPLDWAGKNRGDQLFYFGREKSGKSFEERFRVYGREGEPCQTCSMPIRRLVQAARSTFFCPKCQT